MLQLEVPDDRRQEFADFFENAPIGVLVLGADGTVRYANRAQHEITPRLDLVGAHLGDLVAPDVAAAVLRTLDQDEPVRNLAAQLSGDGGAQSGVVVSSSAWRDPGGGREEVYCFMVPDDVAAARTPLPTA